jgi:hypothetical protein
LAENAGRAENARHIVSSRFRDEDGSPMHWEIRSITSEEDEALRKASTKPFPVPGRRNQFTRELDPDLYLGRLAARCTVFPNLDDAGLQDSYRAMGADALLKAMLTAGEYAGYLLAVQEVNGFAGDFEDEVAEAKNS